MVTHADWISPSRDARERLYDYAYDPPPVDGKKVILLDTDHIWGTGGDGVWVWKAFMRGHNSILMDPYDTGYTYVDAGVRDVGKIAPEWESFRISMSGTVSYVCRAYEPC